MHGEWNGLQTLFLKDCPYAYHIHCLAHRLVLLAAARDVSPIHNFFTKLELIVNIITASPKRHDQLSIAQTLNIANQVFNHEIETSILNQIGVSFTTSSRY